VSTTHDNQEMYDRLVLLLITRPCEGWEQEFQSITRREVERLSVPTEERDSEE
jgi:hypothetical protein